MREEFVIGEEIDFYSMERETITAHMCMIQRDIIKSGKIVDITHEKESKFTRAHNVYTILCEDGSYFGAWRWRLKKK